ncbi:MAG: hypothetical protein ABW184_17270 [Sphingobium sp.]
MHYRHAIVQKLKANDKIAIGLLRGTASDQATPEVQHAFSRLRERVQMAGMTILPSGAIYLNRSELFILGWLAALQRHRVEPAVENIRFDIPEAQLCAQLLDRAGHRLDYSHAARLTDYKDYGEIFGAQPASPKPAGDVGSWNSATGATTALRRKIVQSLADNGPMSVADLAKLGASRQTIGNMTKCGLLKRVRYGVYGSAA